jgi:uncharacterized protein (DUF433 family)
VLGPTWQENTPFAQWFDLRASNHWLQIRIQALLESPDSGSDMLFQEGMRGFMESVIVRNPKILGGTPVFRGTRVPLQLLFDSLERGHTLEEFLAGYPTVSRELAIAALEEAQQLLSAKA